MAELKDKFVKEAFRMMAFLDTDSLVYLDLERNVLDRMQMANEDVKTRELSLFVCELCIDFDAFYPYVGPY